MADFDTSPLPHNQLGSHCVVIASLVLLVRVEVWVITPLYPHMEPCIVPPTPPHQVPSGQILFSFTFVHVKHEEK